MRTGSRIFKATFLLGFSSVAGAALTRSGQVAQTSALVAVQPAPDAVVYEVFLRAVAAWDQRSKEPGTPPERRDQIGQHMREVAGLDLVDYASVLAIANDFVQAMDRIARKADQIARDPRLSGPSRLEELAKLRKERDGEIETSVQRVKTQLGLGFAASDLRVKGHVGPRLKIKPATGEAHR